MYGGARLEAAVRRLLRQRRLSRCQRLNRRSIYKDLFAGESPKENPKLDVLHFAIPFSFELVFPGFLSGPAIALAPNKVRPALGFGSGLPEPAW